MVIRRLLARRGGRRGRRRRRPVLLASGLVLAVLCCCGGWLGFTTLGGGVLAQQGLGLGGGLGGCLPAVSDEALTLVEQLTEEQVGNAVVIVEVGHDLGIPPRGWVIAVATALQESGLRNLGHLGERNDHDSLGLFQQRPSQGWGTPEQILDPRYASTKFYEKLVTVEGWETMPLTRAAQAVQRSAYPDAYARHEPLAVAVVNAVAGGIAGSAGYEADLRCAGAGEVTTAGWARPVAGPLWSGFRTPQRPAHHGIDIGAPKGTPIYAAADGVVIMMRCDASTAGGAPYSCDVDGSPSIRGCGWYIDILHAGDVVTRYCHMLSQPMVGVGDPVAAGQPVGVVGSSGRSSGPHLHFEVHLNGDRSSAGAIDPVPFLAERGITFG